jgi:hypothetical protein
MQFTEDFQVAFLKQYHKVFDRYIGKYLIGELVWNFADFRTGQSRTSPSLCRVWCVRAILLPAADMYTQQLEWEPPT